MGRDMGKQVGAAGVRGPCMVLMSCPLLPSGMPRPGMHQPTCLSSGRAGAGGREGGPCRGLAPANRTLTAGRSLVAVCRCSASKTTEDVTLGIAPCRTDGGRWTLAADRGVAGWFCRT